MNAAWAGGVRGKWVVLIAPAMGLGAAIPASIFYNKFASEGNRQAQRLEGFADEFSAILSRQIDERGGGAICYEPHCETQIMAMNMAGSSGGGGRRGRRRAVMAEINVTPMVDVMLVL